MGRILVFGWYGHGNVGDELMAEGLRRVLVGHDLRFVDHLRADDLRWCQALVVGGGSFLGSPLSMDGAAWHELARKPVAYVGVGAETDVHDDHVDPLRRAFGIFVRSAPSAAFSALDVSYAIVPDLSLALSATARSDVVQEPKRLLVLPNAEVVPDRASPNWKRAAWDYYKSECAQALDELIDDGWSVGMAPLCSDRKRLDERAAHELAAHCCRRDEIDVMPSTWFGDASFARVRVPFDRASVVLTQRYHGAPIAQATVRPCVVVHHHDKLARVSSRLANHVPYYGVRKDLILRAVRTAARPRIHESSSSFSSVREAIDKAL